MEYKINNFSFKILSDEERKTFGYNSQIDDGVIYIDNEQIWMKCPCGNGYIYKLNTHDGITTKWTYVPPNSIKPSINHISGCKCHFTITNGKPQ